MTVGISSSAAAGNPGGSSFINIYYGSGAWRGRIIQTGTAVPTFGVVSAGTRFSLRYDGTETTFHRDGVELQPAKQAGRFIHSETDAVPSNIGGWMISGSITTPDASADQITNVIFLP